MLPLITKLLLLASTAVCYGVQAIYFTHMLQLNSYRDERYMRWCNENTDRLVSVKRLLPLLAAVLAFISLPDVLRNGIATVLFLLAALLNRPQKAKKPLVVTARVKRLFAVEGILLTAALAGAWFFSPWRALLLLGLFGSVVWFWVRLAAWIASPLEKAIAARFVQDARRRMQERPDLTVIGITGSYGKTSTKNFLQALLSVKYNVLITPENFNTTLGVVRTIREHLRPSHQIFVCEMGAKNVGDIKEICDLVHPKHGMITSIGEQHLETFGSLENIISTKFELADALPQDGMLFLNTDNAYIREQDRQAVGYGLEHGDYTVHNIYTDQNGTHFTVANAAEEVEFTTRLLGAHNIQNLVGCIAVAHCMGIELKDMAYPIRLLKPVPHRLQLLPNGFIDDAYNSNPAGFRSALDTLSGFDGQRVLITPGMVELGERQEALNRELGEYAATRCDYAILVGEKQAPPLKAGLLNGGFDESHLFVAPTLNDALAILAALPQEGRRTVLLENDLPDNF
ncbi:MAG: UDP-N-acetylmuramoyl-tripeptide--D-alanyl-D-alanine ligase [Ruminococcaceae bacterium]|nr:UDP-N-acetylmuramoyl-tripeptide--D-alanyl-D-alanine ligase [Oscillospiraceae bacterium]